MQIQRIPAKCYTRNALVFVCLCLPSASFAQTDHEAISGFINLLKQRLIYSKDVAEAKFNSGAPVEDLKREASLIEEALKHSGQDHNLAAQLLRDQIEASNISQRSFLTRWAGHSKFADAPDLALVVRPKLDSVTSDILTMLQGVARLRKRDLLDAAGKVQWPAADRDCCLSAWKTAIKHLPGK